VFIHEVEDSLKVEKGAQTYQSNEREEGYKIANNSRISQLGDIA